jgi:hypothetical protein
VGNFKHGESVGPRTASRLMPVFHPRENTQFESSTDERRLDFENDEMAFKNAGMAESDRCVLAKGARPSTETETGSGTDNTCLTCAGTGVWYDGTMREERCANCDGRGWR